MNKIIEFLLDEQVDYIEEILTNYLDIFLFTHFYALKQYIYILN